MTTKRIKFRVELRGNHGDAGSRRQERLDLTQCNTATAHHENVLALEIHFDGEEVGCIGTLQVGPIATFVAPG